MMSNLVVSTFALLVVACGSTHADSSASDASQTSDAGAATPSSSADAAADAEAPVDNGPPVTTFSGAFHALEDTETNLTVNSDGTWSLSTWLCGNGGGGGGCNGGAWQANGNAWRLVPVADGGATFGWGTHQVTEVNISIVNGVLRTVSSDGASLDFGVGYRCYDSCEKNTFKSCDTPRHCS